MTKESFELVCKELETTHEGLTSICKRLKLTRSDFYDFKDNNEEAEDRYARARELQIDYLEEQLKEIVYDESRDRDVIGAVNVGSNAVARDRLKADTLKFILSKLRANVYGQKIEINDNREPRVFNIE